MGEGESDRIRNRGQDGKGYGFMSEDMSHDFVYSVRAIRIESSRHVVYQGDSVW